MPAAVAAGAQSWLCRPDAARSAASPYGARVARAVLAQRVAQVRQAPAVLRRRLVVRVLRQSARAVQGAALEQAAQRRRGLPRWAREAVLPERLPRAWRQRTRRAGTA